MREAINISLPAAIVLAAGILASSAILAAFIGQPGVTVHIGTDGQLEAISGDPVAVSKILDLRE